MSSHVGALREHNFVKTTYDVPLFSSFISGWSSAYTGFLSWLPAEILLCLHPLLVLTVRVRDRMMKMRFAQNKYSHEYLPIILQTPFFDTVDELQSHVSHACPGKISAYMRLFRLQGINVQDILKLKVATPHTCTAFSVIEGALGCCYYHRLRRQHDNASAASEDQGPVHLPMACSV